MKYQALRGFRDYLPPDSEARARLFAKLREVAQRCGFEEVETPSLESLDLLKAKSGDAIVAETFAFQDKGGREVTMVPENTPSVSRLLVERAKAIPLPVKWFAFPKLWRYEEPQQGRLREFMQLSLDIFGSKEATADVEILATTRLMLDSLGLEGRFVLKLNDRRLSEAIAKAYGAQDLPAYFRAVDRSRKIPEKELSMELEHAGVSSASVPRLLALLRVSGGGPEALAILEGIEQISGLSEEGKAGLENLRTIVRLGEAAGLSDVLFLDMAVVRGLAYYTSTVFEAFDSGQSLRALFGGGRYDKLVELFGGPPTPACGVAIGDQVLELLLRESGLWPTKGTSPQVYVACAGEGMREDALTWVQRLRREGLTTELDLLGRSLSAQMKEASRKGARALLLLAPDEKARGQVVVRNMQTGQQEGVSSEEAVSRMRSVLTSAEAPPPDPA